MPEMMEFTIEVDGTTYADLDFKTSQAVSSFMTGAPEGYTAEVVNIGQAVKVDDVPAGWDSASGKVITLPLFHRTSRWQVVAPTT